MDSRRGSGHYLHVETDGGDVTYFVLHQLHVIERAIASLGEYLARKMDEQQQAERLLRDRHDLNHRQHVLISDALRNPRRVVHDPVAGAAAPRRLRDGARGPARP